MLPDLHKWCFFYLSPGYSPETHTSIHQNNDGSCVFITVGFDPSAKKDGSIVDVATRLAKEGAQAIELCGGFGPEWVEKIAAVLGRDVPVGSVMYGPEYRAKLVEIMTP